MSSWLKRLDLNLPPPLNRVGDWLNKAEHILNTPDEIPSAMNEETASIISRKLEAHKVYFLF